VLRALNRRMLHPPLREGLEETLTVPTLGLPMRLQRFFAITNCIENLIGTVRHVTRNVKRWPMAG
jgi:putative transposase